MAIGIDYYTTNMIHYREAESHIGSVVPENYPRRPGTIRLASRIRPDCRDQRTNREAIQRRGCFGGYWGETDAGLRGGMGAGGVAASLLRLVQFFLLLDTGIEVLGEEGALAISYTASSEDDAAPVPTQLRVPSGVDL